MPPRPSSRRVTVDFEPEAQARRRHGRAGAGRRRADGQLRRVAACARKPAAAAQLAGEQPRREPAVDIGEQTAAVAAAPFQAVFAVPGRLTVPATGEAKRVLLQQDGIEPVLTVRTVPKVDAKAYLYAKLVLPKGSPLLPGAVSLFRDGTFVGTGDAAGAVARRGPRARLRRRRPGARAPRHRRREARRDRPDLLGRAPTAATSASPSRTCTSAPSSSSCTTRSRSRRTRTSRSSSSGRRAPTKKDIDDKRGVIAFESKLEPEEEQRDRVRLPGHLAGRASDRLPLSPSPPAAFAVCGLGRRESAL